MAISYRNATTADDAAVHGLRLAFRPVTTVATAASATDTSLVVSSAVWLPSAGDIYVGDNTANEQRTVSAITGNTLTIDALVGAAGVGVKVRPVNWFDMGYTQSPDLATDSDQVELSTARTGKSVVFKTISTSTSRTLTFETLSSVDDDVIALHNGSPSIDAAVGTGNKVYKIGTNGIVGELAIISYNANSTEKGFLQYFPSVTLTGDGFGDAFDGESATVLQFTTSIGQDADYTIPASIDSAGNTASEGFLFKGVQADIVTALNHLADLT